MPLSDQLRSLARRGAAMRADLFGGSAMVDDLNGPNIAFTPTGGSEVRLRVAFVRATTETKFGETGVHTVADAIAQVPTHLGYTFSIGDRITEIATGTVFRVWRVHEPIGSGVIRLALKKPSPAS